MNQPVNQDAEFCGRVPLHQTNSIQPHGVLLVVEKNSGRILQASENADAIFLLPVKELVGASLTQMASAGEEDLAALLQKDLAQKLPFVLHVNNAAYTAVLQQQDNYCLLEIELQHNNIPSLVTLFREVSALQAVVDAALTTDEACNIVVRELKKLSGFDKLMIYRFDADWNGDVIAEAAEEGMDNYLGLRFPASDIPRQARELYKKAPYRLIPTIDYEPVKLYPVLNPQTHGFTNLSTANLRSVAGVHIEYLRNMKVNASMSTRILVNGQLWGLIACHHRTPNYLSYSVCAVFELLSGAIAAKISAVQATDKLAYQTAKQQRFALLMQAGYQQQNSKPYLLQLLEADGVAVVYGDRIETEGLTPSATEIADLVEWLRSGDEETPHYPQLCTAYEPAEAYTDVASGLLALPVNPSRGHYVLAFRPEAVKKITWSGNPAEAVQFERDGKSYHPRASFKQWQQTVRNSALPWSPDVLQTAAEVRQFLATLQPSHSK